MLLVSRLSKLPLICGGYVNAGSETNEQLVFFQDKILIKLKSYSAVANDSLPISISVKIITMSQLCSLLILLLSVKIQQYGDRCI
jgi:hypothetical protein